MTLVPRAMADRLDAVTVSAVQAEAIRAHVKHAASGMSLFDPELGMVARLAALGEEYGEVCRALTADNWEGKDHLVKELIQLANVALCLAQTFDRYGVPGFPNG